MHKMGILNHLIIRLPGGIVKDKTLFPSTDLSNCKGGSRVTRQPPGFIQLLLRVLVTSSFLSTSPK